MLPRSRCWAVGPCTFLTYECMQLHAYGSHPLIFHIETRPASPIRYTFEEVKTTLIKTAWALQACTLCQPSVAC